MARKKACGVHIWALCFFMWGAVRGLENGLTFHHFSYTLIYNLYVISWADVMDYNIKHHTV
jgi:hypothetical protein